jgi:RecA-family ATPase
MSAPPKPQTYCSDLANLPPALAPLTQQKRWVLWRWELRKNKKTGELKWTKPPLQPDGNFASSSDPSTWSSYEEALDAAETINADGIGYMLLKDELHLSAADLDDCRNPLTGEIAPWAKRWLDRANGTYIEVSPSGTGFRIIGTSDKPAVHAKFAIDGAGQRAAIEVYRNIETGRYVTITGLARNGCIKLDNSDALFDEIIATHSGGAGEREPQPERGEEEGNDSTNSGTDRSADFHAEVWRLAAQGLTVAEIVQALRNYPAADKYGHRLETEILRSYGKWQEQHRSEKKAEPPPPLPFINMSNWDNESVPEYEWAVPNRIPLRQTYLFSGEGAVGKSIVQLHQCAAHALGRDWLGTMPEIGPAIFLDAEDDSTVLHIRLAAILEHYGVTFADAINGGLHLISLVGEDSVLGAPNRNGKIEPTSRYKQLLEVAGDIKPKIIGVASAADVFAGNENDRGQVKQFIGLLTHIAIVANGAVSLITHPSLTGINTGTGLSGTTQWHNSARARAYMTSVKPEKDEQPSSDLREIIFKKNQYGPVSESLVLRYDRGLFLPIAGVSSLDRAAQEVKADEVFLSLLARFSRENRNVSDKTGPGYAPTSFAREDEAQKAGVNSTMLAHAMRRLFKAGTIWNEPYGRPSRPHYRIALKT